MEKRLLCILLSLCMVLTLMPAVAWADGLTPRTDTLDLTSASVSYAGSSGMATADPTASNITDTTEGWTWYCTESGENATDGTNAITTSTGTIASQMLVMAGSNAVTVSFPLTAAAYAAADPAAAAGTDYEINGTDKTLTIHTAKGAAFWSANGTDYLDYTVKLANDINVSTFLWTPVGAFTGSFDGQGHTITGMTVDVNTSITGYAGLFGDIDGGSGAPVSIQNIGLIDSSVNITASSSMAFAGVIAAKASDYAFTNCYVSGTINAVNTGISGDTMGASGDTIDGGFVGNTVGCTFTNCYNASRINASGIRSNETGGFVGQANFSCTFTNCYNTGSINATGTTNKIGGIVGGANFDNTFTNCYNTGELSTTGTDDRIGGIAGRLWIGCTAANCYYLNTVEGKGIGSITDSSAASCGTFDTSGSLTAGTADQFGSDQTLTYTGTLLAALNGWVAAQATPANYQTWVVKSGINGGYPVFGIGYDITASSAANGSYTVKVGGSNVTSAQAGDSVTITPASSSGYEVDTVSVCKTGDTSTTVTVNNNTFTMPAYPVTVSVTFKAASTPSTGGGHSGGGGSALATPAAPVIVDGKTENIGKSETNANETKITVDSGKLTEKIKTAKTGSYVQVPIPEGKAAAAAAFVLRNIEDMAKKDMTLEVKSGDVSYELPATAMDTAAVMKALGASYASQVPLCVTITKLEKSAVTVIGGELIIPPVEFTIVAAYGGKTVEMKEFSQFVQRSIEISKEQAAQITTAVVKNEDGTLRHVPTYVYEKDGKWFARINSRTNSTYALIHSETAFADTRGKWYEAIVSEMASRKIVTGRSETSFDGGASITRAEFAAILVRALGLPADGESSFTDVNSGDWYCGAINTAAKYGMVNGYTGGSFGPNENITRQEAMAMTQRAAKIAEFAGSTGSLASFTDSEAVSAWAKSAAEFNVGSGLIVGSNGALRSGNEISRAETATVILRLLQKAELVDVRSKT